VISIAVYTVASVHYLNLHFPLSIKHTPSVPTEAQLISVM